jgi:hypothetical protein
MHSAIEDFLVGPRWPSRRSFRSTQRDGRLSMFVTCVEAIDAACGVSLRLVDLESKFV